MGQPVTPNNWEKAQLSQRAGGTAGEQGLQGPQGRGWECSGNPAGGDKTGEKPEASARGPQAAAGTVTIARNKNADAPGRACAGPHHEHLPSLHLMPMKM